jgi:hypothetical protein
MVGEISGQFSPTKFHLLLLKSLASCGRGGTWRRKLERPKLGERGFRGCTISLQAAVHPRPMSRALLAKKKKNKKYVFFIGTKLFLTQEEYLLKVYETEG